MTDLEEVIPEYRIHVVKAAARPKHTLLGDMERTSRWTLRIVIAGTVDAPGFDHFTSNKGRAFSSVDTLYYDN